MRNNFKSRLLKRYGYTETTPFFKTWKYSGVQKSDAMLKIWGSVFVWNQKQNRTFFKSKILIFIKYINTINIYDSALF